MVVFPHCKINLGLQVLSKREDGYHAIETCFYPVPRLDALEAIRSEVFSFDQTGISIPGAPGENLCLRAYELLKKDFDLPPVKIHLHKLIPLGAGLGGGSSDAAFMLKLLNQLFQLSLEENKLRDYASRLGSDCAFFTQSNPMIGTGRGEVLQPINLSLQGYWIAMVKPEVHISTATAYAGIKPAFPERELKETLSLPIEEWKSHLANDFEKTIFEKFPLLKEIKDQLYAQGAIYAAMSGSGSTLYGLFKQAPRLQTNFAQFDYWEGELK